MLETYFVKPETAGRIRACWIGAEIESYAGWLAEQGYRTRTVRRHVQVLVAFGEFARRRGASALADLPAHVDDFVAMRVASFRRGRDAAAEVRGPVEQMLTVILPGFERTGRPRRELPFARSVPGFFEYLAAERGLRPESVVGYRHHLACSRLTWTRSVSPAWRSCRRRSSARLSPSVPGRAWLGRQCGAAAGCCACSSATRAARGCWPPT